MSAILIAFANHWGEDRRYLRGLLEEGKAIGNAFLPLLEAGLLILPAIHNARIEDVIATFQSRRHRDQIRIFHFGGHAGGSGLMFEDETGQSRQADARGLAAFLGKQRGLVLVFLNGCSTEPQVRRLRAAGVKAVVATTLAVHDHVAVEFARAFYTELAARPLRQAFDTAADAIRLRWGDGPRAIMRDVALQDAEPRDASPWVLDCDPRYEDWAVGAEMVQQRRRTWKGKLLLAMIAMWCVSLASLAVSAEARHSTCRISGLRPLCTAIGIGNLPTPAETAQGSAALAQHSKSRLQAYLEAYPEGADAETARAMLLACKTGRTQILGSEENVGYPWNVRQLRAHPLPTEDAARRDAVDRGFADATGLCAVYRRTGDLLSAHIRPDRWECFQLDDGFTCGFDGELTCRVRYWVVSDDDICH